VRTLAKYAANSSCRLATLGFAARVDFDKLLAGTRFAAPFGQSPFAFRRGNRFEETLRENGHAPLLGLLGEALDYDTANARVENLRKGAGRTMEDRSVRTRALVKEIVSGKRGAPNLLDGAVLSRSIGGTMAYFEADAVAAHFERPIHAGEIKSFPTVDGQADPDKMGAAIAQVSIYILLLRELAEEVGGKADQVTDQALVITAKNTGLQPTIVVKSVGREIDRAARILAQAPTADQLAKDLSPRVPGFGVVAAGDPVARIEAAHELAEQVGTNYRPECLSSCGLSRLCRHRAREEGCASRVGSHLVRLLPNIDNLDRATELADGAKPTADEQSVAEQLQRAAKLRLAFAPTDKRGRR